MTSTTGSTALDVVAGHHRAWTSGDLDRAMALVAESVLVCDRLSYAPPDAP
jgi:hypothetical protein